MGQMPLPVLAVRLHQPSSPLMKAIFSAFLCWAARLKLNEAVIIMAKAVPASIRMSLLCTYDVRNPAMPGACPFKFLGLLTIRI